MDKTLVEMCLQGKSKDDVEVYLASKGMSDYLGGWSNCEVVYLQKGEAFILSEYDGAESLETVYSLTMGA